MQLRSILFVGFGFGVVAGLTAGCDEATPGSGGAGSTSTGSLSPTSTTSTTATTTQASSTSTGGMLGTCGDFCAAKAAKAGSLMCKPVDQATCTSACEQNIAQALTCGPLFVDYFECATAAFPTTDCTCPGGSAIDCPPVCNAEYDAANNCLFML